MVYSPAITITLSVHPRHRVSLNSFRPLRVVPLISPFSSRLVVPSISLLLFLFSPSLRFFVRVIPSPLVFPLPSSFPIILSRRPQLFRNCFRPFLLLLRLPQDLACLPLPRTSPRFLFFSHSLSFLSSMYVPFTSLHPVGIHFSFRRIFSRTSRLLFHSRNG